VQLTIAEAARLLHVNESSVQRWIRERGLPAVKFNEQYRLNQVDLLVWAQANQVAVDPDRLPAREKDAPPDLAAALLRGGIHRDVAARNRSEALVAAVARMPLLSDADRTLLADLLAARENAGTTAIGNGIAIPHARHPIVLAGGEPLLALCFLQQPVDFAATDGKPVHTLFALVTPTIRSHLQTLARLAFALGGPFGERVAAGASDRELIDALAQVRPGPATAGKDA
jgi:PTS system nitrogen regulatory IIA component